MGRKVKPIHKLSPKVAGKRSVGIDDDTYKKLRKICKEEYRPLNQQIALLVNRAFKKRN